MSEFTENYKQRVDKLTKYMFGLIEGEAKTELLEKYNIQNTTFMPHDVLHLFDEMYNQKIEVEKIKIASNRLFNIIYDDLSGYQKYDYPEDSILSYLIRDNEGVRKHLNDTKALIKEINKELRPKTIAGLTSAFERLARFEIHYTVKENIVFPEIEKHWDNYQCLKLMWTFHDDIRRNIKKTIEILKSENFDLKLFNKMSGKVYFNINTIIFREENVIFPIMWETMNQEIFDRMTAQLSDFGLAFTEVKAMAPAIDTGKGAKMESGDIVKFPTGELTLKQLELVFNHLPVDITFVDENDKVRYFSTPKDRIFPRTVGIIGRNVKDCHPHESVDVVTKIVAAFKAGEKDDASFWLKMGPKYVLIQYFAVRDAENCFKGVLEVSLEISDIQKIEGEHRLLDWA